MFNFIKKEINLFPTIIEQSFNVFAYIKFFQYALLLLLKD